MSSRCFWFYFLALAALACLLAGCCSAASAEEPCDQAQWETGHVSRFPHCHNPCRLPGEALPGAAPVVQIGAAYREEWRQPIPAVPTIKLGSADITERRRK